MTIRQHQSFILYIPTDMLRLENFRPLATMPTTEDMRFVGLTRAGLEVLCTVGKSLSGDLFVRGWEFSDLTHWRELTAEDIALIPPEIIACQQQEAHARRTLRERAKTMGAGKIVAY